MADVLNMRAFVNQRLNAAVEEILVAFEETILKFQEETALSQEVISRQHALLCALHKPLMDSPSADVFTQQLLQSKKDASKLEDRTPQQDIHPEPSLFKEEQQEEHLQDLDENEIIEFTYNSSLAMKSCEDLQPLVEPRPVGPDQGVPVVLSSETEDSEDYSKDPVDPTTDTLQGLCRPKGLTCSVCSRTFKARSLLLRHVKAHAQEAKQVCGLCGEQFETAGDLRHHLLTHRRKRKLQTQARTQYREKRRQERSKLSRTAKELETQKPDECKDCGKTLLTRMHRCRPQRKNQDTKNPEKSKKRRRRKT